MNTVCAQNGGTFNAVKVAVPVIVCTIGTAFRPGVLAAPSIVMSAHDHMNCYADDHTGIISLKHDLARQPSQINVR